MLKGIDFLPNSVRLFFLENRFYFQEKGKNHTQHLKDLLLENSGKSLPIQNEKLWIESFNKLTYAYPELIDVAEAFCQSEIRILQDRKVSRDDILAICVAKNDFIKVQEFIRHHRSIGIDKFVVLDNDSRDGSLEWIKKQDDVVLMQTKIPYTTNRREGWINRIMAFYGYSRWYMVADSDELLTYHECENRDIHELISYFERHGIQRARGMMVDMYAKPDYYESGSAETYMTDCVYFDKTTYYSKKHYVLDLVCGGPRERIFHQSPWLTKYPLFFLKEGDVQCKSHFLFPFEKNLGNRCNIILRHYKFQPGEIEKIRKVVSDGNYFNGSKQYKAYLDIIDRGEGLNFMCEDSEEFTSSKSLNVINLYRAIEW